MNQPKTKSLATAATVAPTRKTPYTAARHGKDEAVIEAGAEGFGGALDRRVTEGFNLVHGRLDVIQEDVRENRRDLKEFRQELWTGLRDAAGERARLAEKTAVDRLQESQRELIGMVQTALERTERLPALEESHRQLVGTVNRLVERSTSTEKRLAALEDSHRQLVGTVNRLVERSTSTEERLAALEDSQRQLIPMVSRWVERSTSTEERLASLEDSQRQLIPMVSRWVERSTSTEERLASLEDSQRQLIPMVSRALAENEAAAWTRRKITVGIWVAVGAGTSLLVIGAVMRPLLERAAQVLFGG